MTIVFWYCGNLFCCSFNISFAQSFTIAIECKVVLTCISINSMVAIKSSRVGVFVSNLYREAMCFTAASTIGVIGVCGFSIETETKQKNELKI